MGVIIKGSIAEEYALHKQIEELMNGTDIPRNITNLGRTYNRNISFFGTQKEPPH